MTDILIGNGTAIILGNSATHSPTTGNGLIGADTDQLNLTNIAVDAYRQSIKFDFGVTRAVRWLCRASIELFSAPTAGGTIEFYMGFSDSATAGENNPGNLSGTDSAYTGYGGAAADADECIGQLVFLGSMVVSADADVHIGEVGVFTPHLRWGCLVVRNKTSVALAATDVIETSVHLIPIQDQF